MQRDRLVLAAASAMKSLILVAHGSRRAASNAEILALTERLRHRVRDRFDYVDCAFWELAEPSIPAAIDAAVQAGSREITILPYFLACGTHVNDHIPLLISAKRAEHPEIAIELKPYIGKAPTMVDVLASVV